MSSTLRVTSTDPRLTRTVRSWGSATERAQRLTRLVGSAEIQRFQAGAWQTVEMYTLAGSRVSRQGVGR